MSAKNTANPDTWIVAHHDYWAGRGADDNASGMAVLKELSEHLKCNNNIGFASFDLEEANLVGSSFFNYSSEKPKEVICLDSIGSGSRLMYCNLLKESEKGTEEYSNGLSNKALVQDLQSISESIAFPIEEGWLLGAMDFLSFPDNVKKTGVASFETQGHYRYFGVKGRGSDLIHTENDVPENLNYENLAGVTKTLIRYVTGEYAKKSA